MQSNRLPTSLISGDRLVMKTKSKLRNGELRNRTIVGVTQDQTPRLKRSMVFMLTRKNSLAIWESLSMMWYISRNSMLLIPPRGRNRKQNDYTNFLMRKNPPKRVNHPKIRNPDRVKIRNLGSKSTPISKSRNMVLVIPVRN